MGVILMYGIKFSALIALSMTAAAGTVTIPFPQPQAGIHLVPAELGPGTSLLTYGAVGSSDRKEFTPCSEGATETVVVADESWMGLSLAVRPADREQAVQWLSSVAQVTQDLTVGDLLRRIWRAQARAFDVLAGPRGRPRRIEYVLHLLGAGCDGVEKVVTPGTQARRQVTFPIPLVLQSALDPELQPTLVYRLLELTAHETAHLLQLHPFDQRRLAWLRSAGAQAIETSHLQVSMEAELGALYVDRCVRQAILPNDWNEEFLARAWRERQDLFEASVPDLAYRRLYDRFFHGQAAILGSRFVGGWGEGELEALFPYCAMWLMRDEAAEGRLPTLQETRRGLAALASIRAVTPALRWHRRPYADVPLPAGLVVEQAPAPLSPQQAGAAAGG